MAADKALLSEIILPLFFFSLSSIHFNLSIRSYFFHFLIVNFHVV